MSSISESDLDVLTKWDTPTICNALEVVVPERLAGDDIRHAGLTR